MRKIANITLSYTGLLKSEKSLNLYLLKKEHVIDLGKCNFIKAKIQI